METALRDRRKLFERPQTPRQIRITQRDVQLLRNISRLRLASTSQLAALDGGSTQNVSRSLLGLFENGYVERPLAQVASRLLQEGSRPTIYGLTRKGAALLRQHGEDVRRRLLDGIDKARGAGWRFIEHTVAVSEFLVSLELATRTRGNIHLLERRDVLEDAPKTHRDRQVRLEATIRINGSMRKNSVVPDAFFGLSFDSKTETYFMLEIDRGEMPIERFKDTYRTYFAKKLFTYLEASKQKRQVHELGIPHFRVLNVTTSAERVEKMIAAIDAITNGRGTNLFLFATYSELATTSPLDLAWTSGRREPVYLVEPC